MKRRSLSVKLVCEGISAFECYESFETLHFRPENVSPTCLSKTFNKTAFDRYKKDLSWFCAAAVE